MPFPRRAGRSNYDDSSAASSRPLRLDEVEALLLDGGRAFAGDGGRVVHLLQRMFFTIQEHQRRLTALNDDMDRLRAGQVDGAEPLTRAAEALAALTTDEQRHLLDSSYLAALDQLEQERLVADQARLLAVNDVNRVRHLLASLLDQDLPQEARTAVEALLSQLASLRAGS